MKFCSKMVHANVCKSIYVVEIVDWTYNVPLTISGISLVQNSIARELKCCFTDAGVTLKEISRYFCVILSNAGHVVFKYFLKSTGMFGFLKQKIRTYLQFRLLR